MEWILDVLKETAEKFKSQIIEKVRNELCPRYLRVFDYVFQNYYGRTILSRWYDPYHVTYSTLFATKLVKAKEASSLVIPAIILHDIGYYSTAVDKENWSSKDSRIIHMQEGAGIAAEILSLERNFDAGEIREIVAMVASHDNGYLGIPTKDSNRLALRDADRAWVTHPLSFYKDWHSKRQKGENLSLLELLQSRLFSFYGPDEIIPFGLMRAIRPDKEDAIQSPPYTKLAKRLRDLQFKRRLHEIQAYIISSPEYFQKRLKQGIRMEEKIGSLYSS